jgi:signal transduction histidine kinase
MTKETILVVEDDTNLLSGIRDILELEQYKILTASDGVEGLRILQQMITPPDLIVSDIMMPRMDGIEFLTKVRKEDRFVSVPFIYLTAKSEKRDVQRGKELGVDDYVIKPFNADELLVAVRSRLNRAADMERVQAGRESELKRNILTILNHEFRTPLTFIVAYADMLNDYADGTANGKGEQAEMLNFLQGVKSGADRLQYLIENFIMLVELETGSARKNYEWRRQPITDVHALLQSAVHRAAANHDSRHQVKIMVENDVPEFVGDEEYLVLAIAHLVDNACKFSPETTTIQVGARYEDHSVRLWVKDKGRGIPVDEREKVWDDFYQIDRAYYEDQGAGAGLAIVKGIAELHGGGAELKSQVQMGSTFTIDIPLTPQSVGDAERA